MPNQKRTFSQREDQPRTPPRVQLPRPDLSILIGQHGHPRRENITPSQALDSLFCESSLNLYKDRKMTSSASYHIKMSHEVKKKPMQFKSFDSKIEKSALFHRYTLTEMQALLTPLSKEEKNKILKFEQFLDSHKTLGAPLEIYKTYSQNLREITPYDTYQCFKETINDSTPVEFALNRLKNFLESINGTINNETPEFTKDNIKEIAQYLLRNAIEQHIQKQKGLAFRFAAIDNHGQNEILFSIGTSNDTMSHSQLVSQREESTECLGAGDIHFRHAENSPPKIAAITNRTGHFECTPSTLLFPLNCLLTKAPSWFGAQIEFKLFSKNPTEFLTIDVHDLKERYWEKIGDLNPENEMPQGSLDEVCFYDPNPEQVHCSRRQPGFFVQQQPAVSRPLFSNLGSASEEEKDNDRSLFRSRGLRHRLDMFQQQPVEPNPHFSYPGSDSEEEKDSSPGTFL